MDKEKLLEAHCWVRDELERCVSFWLDKGMDPVNGGVFTCLDRTGRLYSTDKSVWMQGRCAWAFAWLCHVYGQREDWMAAAKSCLAFLDEHCLNHGAGNRLYFTVTGDGKPLRQRRYYYAEAFYAMANAEYYGLTGDRERLLRARWACDLYWDLAHGMPDPTGLGPKTIPETRTGRSFGIPIICLNMTNILLRTDPERRELYEQRAAACVEEVFRFHVKEDLACVLVNVGPEGEARLDISEGRIVSPGDSFEGAWFLLEYARYTGDRALVEKVEKLFHWAMEAGWDKEYGGLLYYIDCLGYPPEAYEHDMKLWWTHAEILISSLMLYRDTGKEEYLNWFFKTLEYCRRCFSDPEYGEWYGYLRRDGKPTEPPCKGSTFKGPFHMPRMLSMVEQMLGELTGSR